MKQVARHRARECVVQALYSWELSNNNMTEIELKFLTEQDMTDVDVAYFHKLYEGTTMNASKLDQLMEPYLSRKLDELNYIELAVLRIALYELSNCYDVPYKVAINEAIELAKTFGSENSYSFVNGLLDNAVYKIRPNVHRKKI